MTSGLIVGLLNQVDSITYQFILNGYQRLVSTYTPAIYSMVSLSVIIYGYATLLGWVGMSLAETSKRCLTIGFVLAFALNWGTFSSYVYDLFTKTPNEISSVVIDAISHSSVNGSEGVNTALEKAWSDGMAISVSVWERGGFNNYLPYVWSAVISISVVILIGISLIDLIVAKFGLAIFLVLAPVIIPSMLFKPTKEILFDGWLRHLIGFAFVPIFVTSALALGLTLLSASASSIQDAITGDSLNIKTISPYVIYLIISTGLVIKSTNMAANIAGGFSSGMSPHFAHAAHNLTRYLRRNFRTETRGNSRQATNISPSNPASIQKQ